jgi:hypothetical protein
MILKRWLLISAGVKACVAFLIVCRFSPWALLVMFAVIAVSAARFSDRPVTNNTDFLFLA